MHRTKGEAVLLAREPINEAENIAISTLVGIMGRESAYSGKTITWEEALDRAAGGLRRIRDDHGARALAGFGSAKAGSGSGRPKTSVGTISLPCGKPSEP